MTDFGCDWGGRVCRAAVGAVRALWDRSGSRAGPAIDAQLSAFADALRGAYASRDSSAGGPRASWLRADAAEITVRLLDAGADPAATLNAYGGTPDMLAMLRSSAQPSAAGVAADIERALATH